MARGFISVSAADSNLVRMNPGEATWTETPVLANSARTASQYPCMANLEAAKVEHPGRESVLTKGEKQ